MRIDANFHGGNIEVVNADDPADVQLRIRRDTCANYAQWFYFRVLGAAGLMCRFRIVSAGDASYPEAWPGGSIVYSHDRRVWRREETTYDGTVLAFDVKCDADTLYVALSPPFSEDQHHVLIANAVSSSFCKLQAVIPTVENRSIELLRIGTDAETAHKIWVVARQHPGEPMAEWFVLGLLERLLDTTDDTARQLRQNACLYVVPNMNPDGSSAGHLRTNAAGVDLNRAWAVPCAETSPEVFGILAEMETTGVDLFLDIHGDEEIPLVFAAGCEGIPDFARELGDADKLFRQLFHQANSDFSIDNGYEPDAPGTADLSIACNQIGQRFGCPSLTIELPFKNNARRPDLSEGWGISRSKSLGASALDAIAGLFRFSTG